MELFYDGVSIFDGPVALSTLQEQVPSVESIDSQELAFLRGIAENPRDGVRRAIYADWLDEQNRAEEATHYRKEWESFGKPDLSVVIEDEGHFFSNFPLSVVVMLLNKSGRRMKFEVSVTPV